MSRLHSSIYQPKPKLPRKRKKAAIKAQGRKWYHDTIHLFKTMYGEPFSEPICKFWVNDSVITVPTVAPGGAIIPVMAPQKYW